MYVHLLSAVFVVLGSFENQFYLVNLFTSMPLAEMSWSTAVPLYNKFPNTFAFAQSKNLSATNRFCDLTWYSLCLGDVNCVIGAFVTGILKQLYFGYIYELFELFRLIGFANTILILSLTECNVINKNVQERWDTIFCQECNLFQSISIACDLFDKKKHPFSNLTKSTDSEQNMT